MLHDLDEIRMITPHLKKPSNHFRSYVCWLNRMNYWHRMLYKKLLHIDERIVERTPNIIISEKVFVTHISTHSGFIDDSFQIGN
ncbi:hypothetical protein TspCOW1_21040 [Thiohalobacter sp. COW1]|nr:hypothetical protein TspCOW1_21040 [Thiohalobacter sp. COW1]